MIKLSLEWLTAALTWGGVMFELEIMVTGYTIVVATTSVVISKCIGKKQLNRIRDEISVLRTDLLNAEAENEHLKKTFMGTGQNEQNTLVINDK